MTNLLSSKQEQQKATLPAQRSTTNHLSEGVYATALDSYLLQRVYRKPGALIPSDVQRLQSVVGNQAIQRLLAQHPQSRRSQGAPATNLVQPQMIVRPARDRYEQEADQVAQQVMLMPQRAVPASAAGQPCGHKHNGGRMDAGKIVQPARTDSPPCTLQRRQSAAGFAANADFQRRLQGAQRGGRALPISIQREFGSKLGHNLSNVRVHTDTPAIQMNREIGARAFTHQDHIYFNAGAYEPHKRAGRSLLAHELTHTIQQTGGAPIQRQPQIKDAPATSFGIQRAIGQPVIQRFFVTNPQRGGTGVDTTGNELVKDDVKREFLYKRTARTNVGLRVADDVQMAVPNTYQTKDFYATPAIVQHTKDVLEAQDSYIDFRPTGASITIPGGMEPLIGVEPIGRNSNVVAHDLGDASSFVDACIEMAHRVTSGRGASTGGKAILKGGHEEIRDFKAPMLRGEEFRQQFPKEEAEELGINHYVSPEVGSMLTTLNLLHRPDFNDFEYHFAGVVAKSGSDYVTLENYNREGEGSLGLKSFFDELMKVEKYKDQYTKLVEQVRSDYENMYTEDFSEEEIKDLRESNEPKIIAAAEAQFWKALEIAKDAEANVITNVRNPETKNALWYFQMYGPPDKKVTVDAVTKNEQGVPTTAPREIDQSFHAHMLATDDFGEALTLNLVGNQSEMVTPSETASGVDAQVANIQEPPQATSKFARFKGALGHLGRRGKQANQLKQTIRALAKTGTADINQINTLQQQLNALGEGRTQQKAAYVLKVLRLYPALVAKRNEIRQRQQAFAGIDLNRLQELAKVSPRQLLGIQKMLASKVVANFQQDVTRYQQIVGDVVGQAEYKKVFPAEYGFKLLLAMRDLQDQLNAFALIFNDMKRQLTNPAMITRMAEVLNSDAIEDFDRRGSVFKTFLTLVNENPDVISHMNTGLMLDAIEHHGAYMDEETDPMVERIYRSPQYNSKLGDIATRQGLRVVDQLKQGMRSIEASPLMKTSQFLKLLKDENDMIYAIKFKKERVDVSSEERATLDKMAEESYFRVAALLKMYQDDNPTTWEKTLAKLSERGGILNFQGEGELGYVGDFLGRKIKDEKKMRQKNKGLSEMHERTVMALFNVAPKLVKDYEDLLRVAKSLRLYEHLSSVSTD